MSNSQPNVIILLASRNGGQFIVEQLESIRAQTYPNWKLLVSDDGSTDDTRAIVEEFSSSVQQPVALCEGPRLGFWQNFASLVKRDDLVGDLYAYCDQDDIWHPEKLKRGVEWFDRGHHDEAALYVTRTELIAADGTSIGMSRLMRRPCGFSNALVQSIGGGNTMIFNRAALLALRRTPADAEIVSHDWWTYQIVSGQGGAVFYDERPSLRYRQHGQNLMGQNTGLRARLTRIKALIGGRLREWNSANLALLDQMRPYILPAHLATLDTFQSARNASLIKRGWLLRKSGVYRQHIPETIALYVSAILGKI